MSLVMPELNQKVLSRRDDIIRGLRPIVPGGFTPVNGDRAVTTFRLQGFKPSVQSRCIRLADLLRGHGALRFLDHNDAN
jgi:hypothetical protein